VRADRHAAVPPILSAFMAELSDQMAGKVTRYSHERV
jgi:hypothetical protein